MPENADVLIVVPPFAALEYPALGPSLLSSGCQSVGINTYVFYPNLELGAQLGQDKYEKFSESLDSEALFAPYAFDKCRNEII